MWTTTMRLWHKMFLFPVKRFYLPIINGDGVILTIGRSTTLQITVLWWLVCLLRH